MELAELLLVKIYKLRVAVLAHRRETPKTETESALTERFRRTRFVASRDLSATFPSNLQSSISASDSCSYILLLPSVFCQAIRSLSALHNWSLISLADLLAFLCIQYTALRKGSRFHQQSLISWYVLIFSSLTLLSHAIFHIVLAIEGDQWSTIDAQWAQLIGFRRVRSWWNLPIENFLIMQVLIAFASLIEIYGSRAVSDAWRDFHSAHLCSSVPLIGSHLRGLCCLLLPAIQLIAGISHPSWVVEVPFVLCWLEYHPAVHISTSHRVPRDLELSWSRSDLAEMDFITSRKESNLTEPLLFPKYSVFVHEPRFGLRHTSILLQGAVFRSFSINFLTYGFPISLLALSFWSFHFASLCAFGLLAYVGYIVYAFPSIFRLHMLNGMLLVFILLWAASTYIFNVAFNIFNKKLQKYMEIWETIGLWQYPIPGFYLLAQFGLGVLIAMCNLVNNSLLLSVTDEEEQSATDDSVVEEQEETTILVGATIAWGFRKSSHFVVLILLFLIAIRPGLIHAIYMIFFLIFLLSHAINWKLRQTMILLCEAHFALQYILQLDLISRTLEQKGSFSVRILSHLGLLNHINSEHFLKISILACFCAIQNHGLQTLLSFSAIVRHAYCPPMGYSILRAGLIKPVLISVYNPTFSESRGTYEKKMISCLSTIRQSFFSIYRLCGKYIAFLTILLSVYLVTPNYASFGYLFFLLLWMSGRQLVGQTRRCLWYPMKVYAVLVFVSIYSIGVLSSSEIWLSRIVDLQTAFGYNTAAPMLKNIWESLAVLVVMQLYSYERRKSKSFGSRSYDARDVGPFAFIRRILVWHIEKILSLSLFYASLSPISAFGFLYLLGLIMCSRLPKSSQIPAKLFLVYSGLLVMVEYLFQMWGDQAEMFPGQENSQLSLFLGLQLYKPGFKGLESGFRGKVLVIIACILQYNVFHWLEKMPHINENGGKWDDPCPLFSAAEIPNESTVCTVENKQSEDAVSPSINLGGRSTSWPTFSSVLCQGSDSVFERDSVKKSRNLRFWESSKDNVKWSRKRILFLRKERLEMQKNTLKVSLEFWMENMFNLFGLEINMIALLLASFAVLNAISLLYITLLAACVILHRLVIQKIWPVFVFLFASIITVEYLVIWIHLTFANQQIEAQVSCHDCWRVSDIYFSYCKKCWLGITVDDPRILISYYGVFMLSCFKFRADQSSSLSRSKMYKKILSQWKFASVLRTLEYDILHLGYLGFALVFFRIRLKILNQGNKIFRFLRVYNFVLIVLSLAYQSPFVDDLSETKWKMKCFKELVGFHKYDYGFRITSRSALVEIIIFMLVSVQSYMFSSQEFGYVSKYLEKEQIGVILRQQEKKAAWKTAQLQQIHKAEELKRLRSLQVDKMKSEMLNPQIQLHNVSVYANCSDVSPEIDGQKWRRNSSPDFYKEKEFRKQDLDFNSETISPLDMNDSPLSETAAVSSLVPEYWKQSTYSPHGIVEIKERTSNISFLDSEIRNHLNPNVIVSAIHLIGNGVTQVKSYGNMAVNNLMNFLKIEDEELESTEDTSEDEVYYEIENQNTGGEHLEPTFSTQSHIVNEETMSDSTRIQIGIICRYMWSQMRSNNDVVCYCCFILIYLWNFSLISVVYLAALFLYALCQNTGPSYIFWIIVLIFTEICILLQYFYQSIIQHCGLILHVGFLQELGFPARKITSSFVTTNLPFFLIYLFTLLQTSISVKDGCCTIAGDHIYDKRRNLNFIEDIKSTICKARLQGLSVPLRNVLKLLNRKLRRYWKSLTQGAETPPYFVQLSMEVNSWPKEGIQPERMESRVNKLLKVLHEKRCKEEKLCGLQSESRVRVQSIQKSGENEKLCLAVFEVLHASPSIEFTTEEWYSSLTPAADVAEEIRKAQRAGVLEEIRFPYHLLSVIGGGKREIDLYAYVFCADLAVFFLIAIFYQSIIKANSEFLEVYQLEDQFPEDFVLVLMVVFFLIVVHRIVYLCSFATGKVLFYLFNLILFTYSVTKYAWNMDPLRKHSGRLALRAIYLTKAISLALQALQIHFGIPQKSTLYRQFLTSSVSRINFLGFRLYRALPFLYELRCVLDWSCTTTSLTMYDWLKILKKIGGELRDFLEDIHASLFLVKCDVDLNRASHHQGQKQTKMIKFCNGICLFCVLLCVIWTPMLMYSSGNPTNIANPIKDASAQVDIKTVSGRLTLFETTLCEKIPWEKLEARSILDPHGYLSAYNEKDIQLICCQSDASRLWLVPPVVQARFMESLRWNIDITFSWQFARDRPKEKEVVKYELTIEDQDLPNASEVMEVFNGSSHSFTVLNVYPRYFRVTGSGDVRSVEQSVDLVSGKLVLNRGNTEWWSFYDINASEAHGCGKFPGPMAIIVSEETPQGILGETLSKFSIWGLYITFVLAVGRFIRLQCADLRMRIPFENLPSCDRLMAICEDISAARAAGELEVEEVLYWTLVKIYRSPHMLLEYTQPD
ncbi:piezo-type mechanosensitive ion channel-like protein isoform X1 [Senna tora]|uniref:Piezo-type mechanosensitive ion channel-like protein isoform X1 n=1 Tax=Senna tora TaxID=362788 RepID=A0A834W0V7_9FABA|nr:piezo-type mechanosensitive ion channel-like protein isoform X1 [Senna tora]